jgi:uncharacterized protein (DUF362 family)
MKEFNPGSNKSPRSISRRTLLKLLTAGFLSACSPVTQSTPPPVRDPEEEPTATSTIAVTAAITDTPTTVAVAESTDTHSVEVAQSTATPTATLVQTMPGREEIMKIYPDGSSVIARTWHAGVWQGEALSTTAIYQMLDTAITQLTGLDNAYQAWATLFDPGERIAIKVNTIQGNMVRTHLPLVLAVAEHLQEIGIPSEQIVIYDRSTRELQGAGYPVNRDGPGVRCYGTDGAYTEGWLLLGDPVRLSDILLDCDALINIPLLKLHRGGAGITFAMKNHYGTFDRPQNYHGSRMARGIAELNSLLPIRERSRLLIGDALRVVTAGRSQSIQGNSIYMSFDPVALDTIGLQDILNVLTEEHMDTRSTEANTRPWLIHATELGLGTDDIAHIELRETTL